MPELMKANGDGSLESVRPDEVGGPDEQLQGAGGEAILAELITANEHRNRRLNRQNQYN